MSYTVTYADEQERENEIYAINNYDAFMRFLPMVDIYPAAISDVIETCNNVLAELGNDFAIDYWSIYDDIFPDVYNRGNSLTNNIIMAIWEALEQMLEDVLVEGTEFDWYANGSDSDFYVNHENINCVDLRPLMKQ